MYTQGKDGFWQHQFKSFGYAVEGITYSFQKGTHLKIHVASALVVIFLGLLLSISWTEWLVLTLTVAAVISAEIMNTAVEETCNLLHPEHHPKARLAKHCAAGAVLLFSLAAIIVGLIIFVPKL